MYIFIALLLCGILSTTCGSLDETTTTVSAKLSSGKATTNEEAQFIVLANEPSSPPTQIPTEAPTKLSLPTLRPIAPQTLYPTFTKRPSFAPTRAPSKPTFAPTKRPTGIPSIAPPPTTRVPT